MAMQIRVRGQVQGVGFRPFVWRLAREMGLVGEVLNDPEGVLIRIWGPSLGAPEPAEPEARIRWLGTGPIPALAQDLAHRLLSEAPVLARVDAIEISPMRGAPAAPEGFTIAPSQGQGGETRVTPDAATCPECLAEIHGEGRRRGYAFTNCTHCGPRFSILRALPYDRARTTMAGFTMCPECGAEYGDPGDRRFHAQPIACPVCGPRLVFEQGGRAVAGDPLALAVASLRAGQIVAIKGLGGFHLACDARNPKALATLRARKHRPTKPFALMARAEDVAAIAEVGEAEWQALRSPAAPVVVMAGRGALPDLVAPGLDQLGVMLPYTPLHHLLIEAFAGVLVMTSGNLSGEPQVIGNDEARHKLAGFADAMLMHNREIARRLDDSVLRARPAMVLRHARGRVPGVIDLPPGFQGAPQVLALGGQMKGAICLLKNGQALLSHHLGDLDDALCLEEFHKAVADYTALFDLQAERIMVDAHPGYRATIAGAELAAAAGLEAQPVHHHHAHLASCLAENGWPRSAGAVAGIVLDGTGLGADGTLWGGELLLGAYQGAERIAHLAPAPLPGGDRAAREPWRNALMRLDQAGCGPWAEARFAGQPIAALRSAAKAGLNAPLSSSAGRLFDALAAMFGICVARQSYEGEAAMQLEALAARAPDAGGAVRLRHLPDPAPRGAAALDASAQLDPRAMIAALVAALDRGVDRAELALEAHLWLARGFAAPARALVAQGAARAVALSGGCLQNVLLAQMFQAELDGLEVLTQRSVPANDGGLALGQAVIGAARALI